MAFPPISLTDSHILFCTEHLVAVNKEAGWPVHATRDPNRPNLEQATGARFEAPVAAVHRLDVWTSGVVLLARTTDARRRLTKLFEQQSVTKVYEAVCLGVPLPRAGTLKHYLAKRRQEGRDVMHTVRSGGKVALTDYTTIGVGKVDRTDGSLVRMQPRTGRTHQLRVQAADAGWPILGDDLYGPSTADDRHPGQLLHAAGLSLTDPWTGLHVTIDAPTPTRFERYASPLRDASG